MARGNKGVKEKGREFATTRTYLYQDQIDTADKIAEKTSKSRSEVVREAFDKVYPKKVK